MTYSPKPSDALERLLRYVQVDTQSDSHNEAQTPSTACQHDLARMLAGELLELGCSDAKADEHAYVTATLPASAGAEGLPALGLIAHIDTAMDAPASGVKPRIVRYEGGPLVSGIVDGETVQTTPEQVPGLAQFVGQDIVVTDGTTLLGADDKAGVAEIMALVARLVANPELAHPALKVAFVPDEEIGHGASLLDLGAFGAEWAYTVDGESLGEFNYECFSASQATVRAHGVAVHPGMAKDVMVNAITVLREFDDLLPANERPEHTEGYEGFFHPIEVGGTALDAAHVPRPAVPQPAHRRLQLPRRARVHPGALARGHGGRPGGHRRPFRGASGVGRAEGGRKAEWLPGLPAHAGMTGRQEG